MNKCILIIDEQLSTGIIANVAAVLSLSIGYQVVGLVGADIADRNGFVHRGLTQLPIPVLGASAEKIRALLIDVLPTVTEELLVVDFNNYAQQAKTYDEYTDLLQNSRADELTYLGLAVYGAKKTVNKLTQGLSLITNS